MKDTIKIKRLNEKAKLPSSDSSYGTSFKVVAISEKLHPNGFLDYDIGLAITVPDGFIGLIFPLNTIEHTTLAMRSGGIIYPNSQEPLKVFFRSVVNSGATRYKLGEEVARIVIVPFPQFELELV